MENKIFSGVFCCGNEHSATIEIVQTKEIAGSDRNAPAHAVAGKSGNEGIHFSKISLCCPFAGSFLFSIRRPVFVLAGVLQLQPYFALFAE